VRRALGAVRFVDAITGMHIAEPLQVRAEGATFVRNLSGAYALTSLRGLELHLDAFETPPTLPTAGSLQLDLHIEDPSRRYLARSLRMSFPRDPAPGHAGQSGSLFTIPQIALYPSPVAATRPGWAVARVRVTHPGGGGVPSAYLRIVGVEWPSDHAVIARGLCDARGEGFLAVSGIPITNWTSSNTDGQPVLSQEIDAIVEAYFDVTAGDPPDPDQIDSRRALLPHATANVRLASGREVSVRMEISLS
jgi:hypothetical protein